MAKSARSGRSVRAEMRHDVGGARYLVSVRREVRCSFVGRDQLGHRLCLMGWRFYPADDWFAGRQSLDMDSECYTEIPDLAV
jgi:hypothetical protein